MGGRAYLPYLPRLGHWAHPLLFLSRFNWLGLVLAWGFRMKKERSSVLFPDPRSSPRLTQWGMLEAVGGDPSGVSI